MLEDACRPSVQMLLVPVAILILPAGGDVEPTFAYGLVAVEAQASFVEASGFGANRLIAWVDDDMEGEFRGLARIAFIIVTHMVLHDGQRQTETDLGGGKAHARCIQHGDAHGIDELVKRLAAQLAVIGDGLLPQHRLTRLHDRQDLLLAADFDEFLDLAIELEIHLRITSEHMEGLLYGDYGTVRGYRALTGRVRRRRPWRVDRTLRRPAAGFRLRP